jgi:hypothetical protein
MSVINQFPMSRTIRPVNKGGPLVFQSFVDYISLNKDQPPDSHNGG